MQITLDVADLFFAFAAVAGGASALLAGAVSLSREPRLVDTGLFATLHAVVGAVLILHGLRYAGLWNLWPHLAWVDLPLQFLVPPLFYVLFRARSAGDRFAFTRRSLLHALPPLAALLALGPLYLSSGDAKLEILSGAIDQPLGLQATRAGLSLVLVFYLAWILLPLVRLWPEALAQRSAGPATAQVTALIAGVFAADALVIIACGVAGQIYDQFYARISTVTLALAMTTSFFVRRWRPHFMEELGEQAAVAAYRYSRLEGVDLAAVGLRLDGLMRERRLYLDEELTLPELARAAQLSPHQLSEYLNQRLGKNFYRFVNEYRVEEACRLLTEKPAATVLEVAYECGFNSRTSFNVAFSRITGRTPLRYRREAAGAL